MTRSAATGFLSRMGRWRVGARWYAVALLTTPLLLATVLLALSLLSPAFLPGILTAGDGADLLMQGVAIGLLAGFFEEIGWSGFAVPRLLRRHGVLATGLMVGMLWGTWHLMADLWGGQQHLRGALDAPLPPVRDLGYGLQGAHGVGLR